MPFESTFITDLIELGRSGVYKITQPANSKIYIGSAFDFRNRWNQHCSSAAKNKHQLPFENALRKYSPKSFIWEVIEEVDISDLCRKTQRIEIRERLLEAEQRWLDSEQPFWWTGKGYNHNPTAGSNLGSKRTGKCAPGVPRPYRQGVSVKSGVGLNARGSANMRAKKFRAIDPNGKIHNGKGLRNFCEKSELNVGAMAAIARGTYISGGKLSKYYKGWTCEYV